MFHKDKSAENPHFDGFLLHTLKTTDKVLRYGENNQVDIYEHTAWRCTHNQHLRRYSRCSIGQTYYTLELILHIPQKQSTRSA